MSLNIAKYTCCTCYIIQYIIVAEHLVNLINGERHLEEYLAKFPPNESNTSRARSELSEARRFLMDVYRADSKVMFC